MLQLTELAFLRHDKPLFENLSCTLAAGELLQVRGQNGSGKSTLLRLLAGLLQPARGTITWQAETITANAEHLQYVGHQNGVKQHLTVAENLTLTAALRGVKRTPREIRSIIDAAGLLPVANTHASHLSAGQGRRLALARLLLQPAHLWILDEPLTALDSAGQAWVLDLLQQQLRHDGCVVLATHQVHGLPAAAHTLQLGDTHA